jgi:hypothetical protein
MVRLLTQVSICLLVVWAGLEGAAHANVSVRASHRHTLPSHFSVGDQYYDGSIRGLQSYLESIRTTEPDLYAKLSPDVQRMNSQMQTAAVFLGLGLVGGLGTTIYGIASRPSCPDPVLGDPNFATQVREAGACTERGMQRMMTFSLIGTGVMVTGLIGAMVVAPNRWDYFNFMNRHNALSPRPMRFQLGYDPNRRFAHAGATFSF